MTKNAVNIYSVRPKIFITIGDTCFFFFPQTAKNLSVFFLHYPMFIALNKCVGQGY